MAGEKEQFEKELSWCISNLRLVLQKPNPSRNQVKEALQALQVLENPKAPIVKKRLAMRNALGDYRAKMTAEEKQIEAKILSGKLKFAEFAPEASTPVGSKVLNKAVGGASSNEVKEFSFNFKV